MSKIDLFNTRHYKSQAKLTSTASKTFQSMKLLSVWVVVTSAETAAKLLLVLNRLESRRRIIAITYLGCSCY